MKSIDVRLYGAPQSLQSGESGIAGTWEPVLITSFGGFETVMVNASGTTILTTIGDGDAPVSVSNIPVQSFNTLFNGTNFDRERANTEETYLTSAARTATVNSADFTNYNARGLHAIINVTSITSTPSIIPFIQGKDPISGTYYDILEGNPITTTGINILKVYPGIAAVVNASANDLLPRTYRVRVTHADTDSITYSVAGTLVL